MELCYIASTTAACSSSDDLPIYAGVVSTLADGDIDNSAKEKLKQLEVSPLDKYNTTLLENVHPLKWKDPEPDGRYNLVVIGGGVGGLVSAAGSAGVGAKVALIEANLLGGDCLNVGCVPSKALLKSAKVAHQLATAKEYGIGIASLLTSEVKVDFPAVMERLRKLRASIAHHDSAERFASLGVDVYLGHGRFKSRNEIEVNGKVLTFARAVVATGGSPNIPAIPGLDKVFNLTKLPAVIGVIGTGPIGCELAQAFARFGAKVHMFLRGDSILRKEEDDAREIVMKAMEKDGIIFHKNIKYKKVEVVEDVDEKELIVNAIVVAAGRKPNVHTAALEKAGIKYDPKDGVKVNDMLQTTNPNVFACGDCASKYQFTHFADFMARLVIRNALFFGSGKASSLLVPWATYTDPEVAHVGEYERDLKKRGIEFDTYKKDFKDNDRSIVDSDTLGYVKILTAKGKDKILGATIVGSHAGDMISELTLPMQSNTGLGKLAGVIHPYPTAAEAIRQGK
eukprot:jgi/Bigna1/56982/fgenesh1_pm.1_\